MKEVVLISGKGGTGKTSLAASLICLASRSGKVVIADCDVDAADMHLLLKPVVHEKREFISGKLAYVDPKKCISTGEQASCAICMSGCRFGAISHSFTSGCTVDPLACEGCGVCVRLCTPGAIDFVDRRCGDLFVSDTRFGPMVHAALDPRAENSGKLVTSVRKEAKKIAAEQNADWLIIDGSPGTGCPVIASVTGADLALIVTEPTVSGVHDLERVAGLARHFSVPFAVCVNKADINETVTGEIKDWCTRNNIPFAGQLPYNRAITRAQIRKKTIVEYAESRSQKPTATTAAISEIWGTVCQLKA